MNSDEARKVLEPELNRRLGDVARRLDGAVLRAGIVIATALVLASIPADPTPGRWLQVLFGGVAIGLAIPSVIYRNGDEVPVGGLLEAGPKHTETTMFNEIFNLKLAMMEAEEKAMNARARILNLSYVALALAAVSVILIHSLVH